MSVIHIGIPCFHDCSPETLQDYMRWAFYVGRRSEHQCFLSVISKREQFRARNAMVEEAITVGADYLLFLDDDHVIDWQDQSGPVDAYAFLDRLIGHMEADPDLGIVGALYYHRGGDCAAVLMKEGNDGGFYYLRDDQIENGLQEVAVQGGGCMLIRTRIFDRVKQPWFDPEHKLGTDLQICKKAREAGWKVASDTSIVLGHVMSRREVVTPKNRFRIVAESAARMDMGKEGLDTAMLANNAYNLYRMDAEEYLGMSWPEIVASAGEYNEKMRRFDSFDTEAYYRTLGKAQLCRQVWFHSTPAMLEEMANIHGTITTNNDRPVKALDFGCGSAPVGFDLALRGHHFDFVDLDGAEAYEFTKWRAQKRGLICGWELKGPYDYALLLDALEHIPDWEKALGQVCDAINKNGFIVTNYFLNDDFDNVEHVSMDHRAVQHFLNDRGFYPMHSMVWIKRNLAFMDKKPAAA